MKYLLIIPLLAGSLGYGQLSIGDARDSAARFQLGSYSYHDQFTGHEGYGAPLVLTNDGGAVIFGDAEDSTGNHGLLVKLDKNGGEEWKQPIRPLFDEMESQSVIQDRNGNYYVFILSYDYSRYRGGCERIVHLDKDGTILWEQTIGNYGLVNTPVFSYIRSLEDGRISIRGHVVPEKPVNGKDPEYHYWEGWINPQGKLQQQTGDVIDWANQEWQKLFEPE